ncbi:alpha-galactosidase [Candidatus Sumerlaeota bacterium]|nr:alpha-galactosidase [Candidatus Sumerlaeota bacterium]
MKRFNRIALALFSLEMFSILPVLSEGGAPGDSETLENSFFVVDFNRKTGYFKVTRKKEPSFLLHAVSRVDTSLGIRATSDPDYQRSVEIQNLKDKVLGNGQRMIVVCRDEKKQIDLDLRISLYDTRDAFEIELICRNASDRDIFVPRVKPVNATGKDNGACVFPGATTILTNGKMYYDAGRVLPLVPGKDVSSWWNVCLYRGEKKPGLVIGYLGNPTAMGEIKVCPVSTESSEKETGRLDLTALSGYQKEFVLKPGATVSSDRLIFQFAPDSFQALELYSQAISELYEVRLNPTIHGWCSWFSFFGGITEEEVLKNAEFAARHLKPYGFEYIQIDDGFYTAFGNWEGNDRFPHGMKWLADKIREQGMKPGIWFAPYVIHSGTALSNEHPDWLIHNPDGKLKQVHPYLPEGSPEVEREIPKRHVLDITHPDAAKWLSDLFHAAAHEWGYEFIKVDFVDWSALAADRYHDPTVTRAAFYRKGAEIMRQAAGSKTHILDCGPGNVSVGLIDSMRIELDQPPCAWNQYYENPPSTGPAMAKRYYCHGNLWINDADHLVMMYLTTAQAQAAASLIGLSGGTVISGDRLTDLDQTQLEILRKILPSYGRAAKPIDLFERDRPEIFALTVSKPFGQWIVAGLFNSDAQNSVTKKISLERLGLDSSKTYLAFDFWKQKFFGEIKGTLETRLEPSSVCLLAIHEKKGEPQALSTDRHILQGALELENVEWNPQTRILKGVSLGPVGSEHRVYVYAPDSREPWDVGWYNFRDYPGYTVKRIESNIIRVHVRFEKEPRVSWQINYAEF